MSSQYHYVGLKREIKKLNCNICQQFKNDRPRYGHSPPRKPYLAPWYKLAVESIGPWSIKVGETRSQAKKYEFHALTCMDTVSNLVELIRSEHLMRLQHVTTLTKHGSTDTPGQNDYP